MTSEAEAEPAPNNVIPAHFGEEVYNDVYVRIKRGGGHVKAEKDLLEMGLHPTYVTCVIRKIMKERGW